MALAGVRGVTAGGRFAGADWLGQVAWCGLLGLGLMTAIPAAGWQELRRRRREAVSGARNASKPIR